MQICASVIDVLNCPVCGAGTLEEKAEGLSCVKCGMRYSVRNGVPILYGNSYVPDALKYESSVPKYGSGAPFSDLPIRRNAFRSALKWRLKRLDEVLTPSCPVAPPFWMSRVVSLLPPSPRKILDLGGGDGRYKPDVVAPGDDYLILEADDSSYFVQENFTKHHYVIGDGHTSLFKDNSFDVILVLEVLEHVSDPAAMIKNCGRWLRPGGVLVISAPQYWHVHGWPHDYFRYTLYGLQHLTHSAGLKPVQHWAMGGPCVLMWCVADLNFSPLMRLPVFKHLVSYPLLFIAKLMDRVLFHNNETRENPDTRGWMLVAKKP